MADAIGHAKYCGTKGASRILDESPSTVRVKARAGELPVAIILDDGQRIFHIPTLRRIAQRRRRQAATGIGDHADGSAA